MGATKHALNGMDKFCGRNVDVCNISSEAWKSLKYKAAYSFDLVANMAKEIKKSGNQPYSPVYQAPPSDWRTGSLNTSKKDQQKSGIQGQNTLTSNDLKPAWSLKLSSNSQ